MIGFNAEFLRDGRRLDQGRRRAPQADQPAPAGPARRPGRRLHLPDHADQAGRLDSSLIVRSVSLRDFRSYERLELELEPGLVLVTGANGAGKTNLLESLHVGTQGFSPRTRSDAQLVRLGASGARVALAGTPREPAGRARGHAPATGRQAGEAERRAAPLGRAAADRGLDARLHARPARGREGRPGRSPRVLRPRARRASSRAASTAAGAVRSRGRPAERRAATQRCRLRQARHLRALDGPGGRARRAARRGAPRDDRAARARVRRARGRARAPGGGARVRGRASVGRRPRGSAGAGSRTRRDWARAASRRRDRPLARRASCARSARRASSASPCSRSSSPRPRCSPSGAASPPLVLLDDVLSELDAARRRTLAERIGGVGQAIVTSTGADALPLEPAQLLEVVPGPRRWPR